MKNKTKLRWFILLPGLTMWLGWGIRGQIGHPTGVMIPGTFLALTLCILLSDKQFSRGLVIGLTAVGFGFGGDMTTLQTAGMVMGSGHPAAGSLTLGYLGLAIKGALWALFGGACLGLALASSRYRRKDIVLGVIFMVASFYVGWALIDRPKLVYFSANRPEIWGGLVFGAVALLSWLTLRGHTRIPLVLALCGVVAGGVGYPVAVTLATIGMHSSFTGRWYDWWKVAETTFGIFMGMGLGIGTYFLKDKLPDAAPLEEPAGEAGFKTGSVILGLVVGMLWIAPHGGIPWIIFGPILLCLAFYSSKAAWHIGVTLVYYGCAANVVIYWLRQQRIGNPAILWALVSLATLLVSWKVTNWWSKTDKRVARNAFISTIWAILVLEYLKMFINRAVLSAPAEAVAAAGGRWAYTVETWGHQFVTNVFFTVAAVVLSWMAYRTSSLQEAPGNLKPSGPEPVGDEH